jgi:hypothetical protein
MSTQPFYNPNSFKGMDNGHLLMGIPTHAHKTAIKPLYFLSYLIDERSKITALNLAIKAL